MTQNQSNEVPAEEPCDYPDILQYEPPKYRIRWDGMKIPVYEPRGIQAYPFNGEK